MGGIIYGYAYDPICSGIVTAESTETTEHLANTVNRHTNILCVPASLRLTREADGNPTLHDASCNRTGVCMPGNRYACHDAYTLIHTVVWDPTEPAATRPLLLQTPSGWFTYAFDQAKNVTELFDSAGGIAAAHDHGPFGEDMAATGSAAGLNPFRFSSEVWDGALGLVCYTFRPYNPLDGHFLQRDPIEERGGLNLYGFVGNDPVNRWDLLGRISSEWAFAGNPEDPRYKHNYLPLRGPKTVFSVEWKFSVFYCKTKEAKTVVSAPAFIVVQEKAEDTTPCSVHTWILKENRCRFRVGSEFLCYKR